MTPRHGRKRRGRPHAGGDGICPRREAGRSECLACFLPRGGGRRGRLCKFDLDTEWNRAAPAGVPAGCREAVEDGVSGYLCPAKDADALTNFFREFAGKTHVEQEQMGRCGRALIERKFDKRIVVAQTIAGLMLPVTART